MHNIFALQKKMLAAFEQIFAAQLTATLRDPATLVIVARWWRLWFDWLSLSRAWVHPWLRLVNLPTNADLSELYRAVHDLEMRLLELEDRVDCAAESDGRPSE